MTKIIFFGTPKFAKEVLAYLVEKTAVSKKQEIVAVVTQSEKSSSGNKNNKDDNFSVKRWVLENLSKDFPLYQVENASDCEFLKVLSSYEADIFLVVAFGQILKKELLEIPKLAINVHASLLPKYRGAAPIQRALINGDETTGITIMRMSQKMDAGDIILQKEVKISEEMTFEELHRELYQVSGPLVLKAIEQFESGEIVFTPQDEESVTFACKIMAEDLLLDFNKKAKDVNNKIRAFSSMPGACTYVDIVDENGAKNKNSKCEARDDNRKEDKRKDETMKKLKIFSAVISDEVVAPGKILIKEKKIFIGCSDKSLMLKEVQLESRNRMTANQFLQGIRGKINIVS